LLGLVIQANGFTRALEMPPSFFYYPVTSAGMVPVVLIALEHGHYHFRIETLKFEFQQTTLDFTK
jgi:hypothetical protein